MTELWIPAMVSLGEKSVQVTTSEQKDEFKVHQLVWMSPESFLLSGIDEHLKFKRVHLRMSTSSEASLAASAIVDRFGIRLEPLSIADEIMVKAHFSLRGRELFILVSSLFLRIVVVGVVVYGGLIVVGGVVFVAIVYLLFVLVLFILAFLRRGKLRVVAWIKFEKASLKIRTSTNFTTMIPVLVQWGGQQTILLVGSRRKVRIYASTPEEAVRIVSKIREKFPGVEEMRFGMKQEA